MPVSRRDYPRDVRIASAHPPAHRAA
jgi:hypothetical protein